MAEMQGLHVSIEASQSFHLTDEAMRVLLFQLVRELLFNVVKHAATNQATIALEQSAAGTLQITISDQGRGFDIARLDANQRMGSGLFSVDARLKLFGGHMSIQSTPGQGTRIILAIPIHLAP